MCGGDGMKQPQTFDEMLTEVVADIESDMRSWANIKSRQPSLLALSGVLASVMAAVGEQLTPDSVGALTTRVNIYIDSVEEGHGTEDDLYAIIVAAIAEGRCTDPQECCRIALKTKSMNIARYYS